MPTTKSRPKKLFFLRILYVLLILILLLIAGGLAYMGDQVVEGSTYLVDRSETTGKNPGFFKKYQLDEKRFLAQNQIESFQLESRQDGHKVPGEYISRPENTQGIVILIHGLGCNRYANYPLADFFLQNGYNTITYDQRNSNENTAERNTYGYWEKYDLLECINLAKEKMPGKPIGLWGTSFGGSTAVLAAAETGQEDLAFLVLDCPLGDVEWMIHREMEKMNMGIPAGLMTWSGNIMNKLKLGFTYGEASAIRAAENIAIPTLVINSRADELTPFFMGDSIFKNLQSQEKQIWTVEDSKHAEIWLDYNEEYKNKVLKFLETSQP